MFDYITAIAQLDLKLGQERPDLESLRARYPELGFVFDALEDSMELLERNEAERRSEVQELRDEYDRYVESLEQRVQELRLGLEQVKEFTSDADVRQIVGDLL
jgi:chromosome segregation ATPase